MTQHRLRLRFRPQRIATIALLAAVAIVKSASTYAQEVPPLREQEQTLHAIMQILRADLEITPFNPTSGIAIPFKSMDVAIVPPSLLESQGLLNVSIDGPALTDFLENAIRSRLDELLVSDQIALQKATTPWQVPLDDCGTIRYLLSFWPHEVELDGRSVFAVVAQLASWQGATLHHPGTQNSECLGDKAPPLSGSSATDVFLVNRGDREKALLEAKRAILSIVDGPILHRLITENDTARRTVIDWGY